VGLSKVYWDQCFFDKTIALADVSLEFRPGEIVAIVGPNGAGKSTLLKSLVGLVAPTSGEIRYDGEPFSRRRIDLRRRIAFLPDTPTTATDTEVPEFISGERHFQPNVDDRDRPGSPRVHLGGFVDRKFRLLAHQTALRRS
jgi:ABC-type multidrug transport system ATPase subunit